MTKICGALGCQNEADGTIPHNGHTVWTCKKCAEQHGKTLVREE